MNQSQRSAVFLQEMGIGPQWLLRDRVPAFDDAAEVAEVAEVASYAEPEAEAAGAPVPVPPPAARSAPAAPPFSAPAPVPEAEPARVPAPVSAPAPAPASAAGSDDTAWFDDAPAPPPRAPTLKQPAAPRAKAAEEPVSDEDTSWFDAVPATPPPAAAARAAISDDDIAMMDLPSLQAAVRRCTRCDRCATRRVAVPGYGDERARWMVLGTAPTAADEEAEQPVAGEPGRLLDNMLRAVDLSTQQGAYVTTLVKCRAAAEDGTERLPTADELAACRPYLRRELELTGAALALTLGGITAKGLLGVAARGKVLHYEEPRGGLPVVATFHPADLLARPEDKAKAWADLCLARSAHAGRR